MLHCRDGIMVPVGLWFGVMNRLFLGSTPATLTAIFASSIFLISFDRTESIDLTDACSTFGIISVWAVNGDEVNIFGSIISSVDNPATIVWFVILKFLFEICISYYQFRITHCFQKINIHRITKSHLNYNGILIFSSLWHFHDIYTEGMSWIWT